MKKFVNIVLGVAAAMGLSSCEDFLTREPINKFSAETYFSTEAELKMYTDGFINSWLPDYQEPAGGDMYNDIIASKQSTNFLVQGYNWTAATQGEWSWSWLRRVNFMLEGMAKNGQNIPKDVYEHYEGVARFWRAYWTFDRMRTYGDIPWTPKYLQPTDTDILYADRLDREYVFSEIVKDLQFAIEKVSGDAKYRTGQVYVNKYVVATFASRAYLYEASFRSNYDKNPSTNVAWNNQYEKAADLYQLAADAAKVVIDSKVYKLSKDYPGLFLSNTLNADEVIWGKTFAVEVNGRHNLSRYYYSDSMGSTPSATKEMVNMFLKTDGTAIDVKGGEGQKSINDEFTGRDKRLAWTVLGPGYSIKEANGSTAVMPLECNYSMTGYMLVKWLVPDRNHFLNSVDENSIPSMRYAEVLLNYAEAMNELGKMSQTIWNETVGLLRARAGVTNIYPTKTDEWLKEYYSKDLDRPFKTNGNEAVAIELRRERVAELSLESGLRQFDLFRWAQMDLCERRGYNGEEAWTGIWLSDNDVAKGFTFQGKEYKIGPDQKKGSYSYPTSTTKADGTWSLKAAEKGGYYLMFHFDTKWEDKMYVRPVSQIDLNLIHPVNPDFPQNYGW
jgi:hypothetical protein